MEHVGYQCGGMDLLPDSHQRTALKKIQPLPLGCPFLAVRIRGI
jgi:hypothetical protein